LEKFAMKKSLIALAALAATGAFAQSSVSIDGQFDVGMQSLAYKGAPTINGFAGNGSTTSQINFRGTEDLGGGLKAEFRVESDWNTASNNGNNGLAAAWGSTAATAAGAGGVGVPALAAQASFANGEIRGGLSSTTFGRVDIGAINNGQLDAYLTGQNFGTAFGSSFRGLFINDTSAANSVRFDNSFRYQTPSFNGVSVSVLNVQKQTAAANTTTGNASNFGALGAYDYMGVNELSLRYNAGPINAIYTATKQDYNNVQTKFDGTLGSYTTELDTFGANYTMGNWKFFVLNQKRTKSDNTLNRNITTASVAYTMGANRFNVQFGEGKDTGSLGNGQNSTLTSLGYDYDLSKTTSLYARYENTKDNGGWVANATTLAAAAGNNTRTRTALGLRIGF
jgi:predicted porin